MSSPQSAHPRHGLAARPLRIALIAARPDSASEAACGAVEEVGRRLVDQGQAVTVLGAGRSAPAGGSPRGPLATAHRATRAWCRPLVAPAQDVVILLDPADVPLAPLLRSRGAAVVVHVGDPDHDRDRTWWPEAVRGLGLRSVDAIVADTRTVRDRYRGESAAPVELIRPGTRIVDDAGTDLLGPLGLRVGGFHLMTAGAGPDDRTDLVLEGYRRSEAGLPLVVVGRVRDPEPLRRSAARDPRIRLLPGALDQRLLDQLHAHAASSIHARDGGTTDGSLLRAMGAATAVLAWRNVPNREVAGTAGSYFSSAAELTRAVEEVERYPFRFRDIGELMQERARRFHDWDVAAEQYGALASKLARGHHPGPPRALHRLDRATSPMPVEFRRS